MPLVTRVLPTEPVDSLDAYRRGGGGRAIDAALQVPPATLIGEIEASGLRGRGGAGFPTGRKWRTVAANCTPTQAATVVVNGAEGEPGCFKDRSIMRTDPYRVVEGALVAARAVGADTVVFALKRTFAPELARIRDAVAEAEAAGWTDGPHGATSSRDPSEYLYGEETGLLEAIDGRYPFPRVAPPYRRGVDEVLATPSACRGRQRLGGAGAARGARRRGRRGRRRSSTTSRRSPTSPRSSSRAPSGSARSAPTGSPGTIVCTVSGAAPRHGVGEFAMGTPLREVLETVGGVDVGARRGR